MITLRLRNALWARCLALTLSALVLILAPNTFSSSTLLWAQDSVAGARKIVTQVTPQYPSVAHRMDIRGTVKVEAVVAPNGTPKMVEVKGGHPLLAQSASNAVRLWKWEPAAHETHELIEIKFNPQ